MRAKKGFNLIELMVVIAIIAILASVALPMYSSFKKRTKTGMAVKVASQTTQVLQAWFDNNESFSGISLNSGDVLNRSGEQVGATLGEVDGISWAVSESTESRIIISWAFDEAANCNAGCSGNFCIVCPEPPAKCVTGVDFSADNRFGFSSDAARCQ